MKISALQSIFSYLKTAYNQPLQDLKCFQNLWNFSVKIPKKFQKTKETLDSNKEIFKFYRKKEKIKNEQYKN